MIELPYVDRNKRIMVRAIEVGLCLPLGLFFLLCIYYKYDETILEQLFGLESYWRTIGWIGLPIVIILYVILGRIILTKNGDIKISADKIELSKKGHTETFYTSGISKMTLIKDIPYRSDDRSDSQKASRLIFNYQGLEIDIEFKTYKISEIEELGVISNHWKDIIKDYNETYK